MAEQFLNASHLDLGSALILGLGTKFQWHSSGINLTSEVKEFTSGRSIAWESQATGIDSYQAWLITPTDSGCNVTTAQTQNGFLAMIGKGLCSSRAHEASLSWLQGLKASAEASKTN